MLQQVTHYAAFIYSSLLLWAWFQAAAATLIDNRDLVRRSLFPRPLLRFEDELIEQV